MSQAAVSHVGFSLGARIRPATGSRHPEGSGRARRGVGENRSGLPELVPRIHKIELDWCGLDQCPLCLGSDQVPARKAKGLDARVRLSSPVAFGSVRRAREVEIHSGASPEATQHTAPILVHSHDGGFDHLHRRVTTRYDKLAANYLAFIPNLRRREPPADGITIRRKSRALFQRYRPN